MEKAVIYCHTSGKCSKTALERQSGYLRQCAEKLRFSIVDELQIYEEVSDLQQEGWKRLMEIIDRTHAEILVVCGTQYIAKRAEEQQKALDILKEKNVRVYCMDRGFVA